MNKKYRIVEEAAVFYIEVLYKRKVGIFIKKEVEEWKPIDINGRVFLSAYQIRMGKFYHFDDAKKVVNSLKKGTVIHDC